MKPLKLKINKVEQLIKRKIKRNTSVYGFDTSTRTGWCYAKTTKTTISLTYGFFKLKEKEDIKRYNEIINTVSDIIRETDNNFKIAIVEDTFYQRNPNVFKLLSRLGVLIYSVCRAYLSVEHLEFVSAITARTTLGLPGRVKKEVVHKVFHTNFPEVKDTDPDIVDGIILALYGLSEQPKLYAKQKRLRSKTRKSSCRRVS
jgi:predicted nicotinamide N-methyase